MFGFFKDLMDSESVVHLYITNVIIENINVDHVYKRNYFCLGINMCNVGFIWFQVCVVCLVFSSPSFCFCVLFLVLQWTNLIGNSSMLC